MCCLPERFCVQLDDSRAGAVPQRHLRDGRRHHLHEMPFWLLVCKHGILNSGGLWCGLL